MPDKQLVAVIDIGKTNAKVAVFDLSTQQEIDRLTQPNKIVTNGIYPHYDADQLWNFIIASLRTLNLRHHIDAISITTHGASAALLNDDGKLALPVLDYEYEGPQKTSAQYDALRPAFDETGSPRLPNGLNLGAQLFWQQSQFPEAFAQVRWIVTYPQYWAFRLCGVLANEVTSLGCHTDLWNYHNADYSTLVDKQHWRNLMPPLRKANDRLGTLREDLADQTGLSPQTPVYCGMHDSNASLYPHLIAQQPPFSVVSTGTWVICMSIGSGTPVLDPRRDTLMNVNARGQPVPSSRFMGGREFQILTEYFSAAPVADDVKEVLSQSAMLLPSVMEGCGPFPDRQMKWINHAGLTPPQRQIAAAWYLSLMTATCLKLIGARGPIILEGPFCENTAYMQMLSAATGQVVMQSGTKSTGATQGAALLCNLKSFIPAALHPIHSDDPNLRNYALAWEKA